MSTFQEERLPELATLAGYAALILAYGLKVPRPRLLHATGKHHRITEAAGWRILTPRHAPAQTLQGHLTFALKNEGLHLAVLRRVFEAAGAEAVARMVRDTPTGRHARRAWFLYEWLTEQRLDVPDSGTVSYVPVVDPKVQYGLSRGTPSRRHRIRNNLPGTRAFCPMVHRTPRLEAFLDLDLAARAREVVAKVPQDLVARAAAFLLLKDSQSSFAIEGAWPARDRVERWGRAIGEAGQRVLDLDELLRLQRIVIGDDRFVPLGLRTEGGFVGEHDRLGRRPLPEHISARDDDLDDLVAGVIEFDREVVPHLDAVVAAAMLAFGFVYIHPFVDGNGRVHRFLVHHVLARHRFNPAGLVFPVSAAILERIDAYRATLEETSSRMLRVIEWEPTPDANVRVLNETADFYRFFDATPHAEFLYACVEKTIREDLPQETTFLQRYDRFRSGVDSMIDMPNRTLDLLFRFLNQNEGRLSGRAKAREFAALTEEEVARIEALYTEAFPD